MVRIPIDEFDMSKIPSNQIGSYQSPEEIIFFQPGDENTPEYLKAFPPLVDEPTGEGDGG